MQLEKPAIDIVLPPNLREASAKALKLCELFIEGLVLSNETIICLSVDAANKSVQCTDSRLREIVRLFLGAGRFNEFIQQQLALLHGVNEPNVLGELRCVHEGRMRKFVFIETKPPGNSWQILSK